MSDQIKWGTVFAAYYYGEPYRVKALNEAITTMQSKFNLRPAAARKKLLDLFVDHLAENPEFATTELRKCVAYGRVLRRAKWEIEKRRGLNTVYRELGEDELRRIVAEEEPNMNVDELIAEASEMWISMSKSSRSGVLGNWLAQMLSDGQEHAVKEIVTAAIEDEMIVSPEKDIEQHKLDYGLLRTVANRLCLSTGGKRGYWKLEIPELVN